MSDDCFINHVKFLSRIRTSYIDNNDSLLDFEKVKRQFRHVQDLSFLYKLEKVVDPAKFGRRVDSLKETSKKSLTNQNENVKLLQGKLDSKKYFAHSADISSDIHEGIDKDFSIKDFLTPTQLSASLKNPESKTFCLMDAGLFNDIVYNNKLNIITKVKCGSRPIASGNYFLKMCEERKFNFGSFNDGLVLRLLTKLAMIAHDHDIMLNNDSLNSKNSIDIIKVFTNKYNKDELCSLGKNYEDHTSNMKSLCKDIINAFLDICMKYKEKSLIKTRLNANVKKIHAWSTYCETYAHKDSEKFKIAFDNFL